MLLCFGLRISFLSKEGRKILFKQLVKVENLAPLPGKFLTFTYRLSNAKNV